MEKATMEKLLAPALAFLDDAANRERAVNAWLEVAAEGEWDKKGIENCGISTDMKAECPENLITHTCHVTEACAALFDSMGAMFASIGPCNREDLIAGAIMHDIGKLLENDYVDGQACHGKTAKYFRHPITGAYYAKKHGFNDNVVHMVLTHSNMLSPEGPRAFNTPESLILKYIDEMCYKYVEIYWKK